MHGFKHLIAIANDRGVCECVCLFVFGNVCSGVLDCLDIGFHATMELRPHETFGKTARE